MNDIGILIKEFREKLGYTQEQLADKLNKSKAMICRYESNYVMPKLETLISMSIIFNTSLDYLLGINNKEINNNT